MDMESQPIKHHHHHPAGKQEYPRYVLQSPPEDEEKNMSDTVNSEAMYILGGLQLGGGFLMMAFGVASRVLITAAGIHGEGIWAGILLMITGGIGIATGMYKKQILVVSYLILSILTAIVVGIGLVMVAIFIRLDAIIRFIHPNGDAPIAMAAIVMILLVIELVVCIIASGFGCLTPCAGSPDTDKVTRMVVVTSPTKQDGGQAPYLKAVPIQVHTQ